MKNRNSFISLWVYIIIFVVLIAGFVGIDYYCVKSSQKLRTFTFTEGNPSGREQLSIDVSVSKQWNDDTLQPEIPCGAQYDGVLTNNSRLTFKDWTAVLTFSDDLFIDSSWNGDFSSDGKQVTFIARGDPANVAPHSKATFGAIMYSKELMKLETCTVSGYSIVTPSDIPLFFALLFILFLWVVALIVHFIIEARTKKYRRQQEIDSAIIRQSMSTFTGFIDAKDTYTKGHSIRVAEYASEIARRMKMDRTRVTQLYYISLMHDCGKIGIPDAVLQKPGKLTDEEYKLIQSHTTVGDSILVNFNAIPGIRDGAHFHHERYDGKGYPNQLKGEEIPLCARIICVADSFDAMSSNRCYRRHLDDERILNELKLNAGKQFDPKIVPYMVSMVCDGFVQKVQGEYPNVDSLEN